MCLFFRASPGGDIPETPDSTDWNVVDALRLREALEGASILELENIVTGFVGMTIKLDHFRQEFVGIKEFVEGSVDGHLIVATAEYLRRNLPHVGHLLIEAEDLAIQIHHQNPVSRGFEGGA